MNYRNLGSSGIKLSKIGLASLRLATLVSGAMFLLAACNEPNLQTATESSATESASPTLPDSGQERDSMNLTQQLEFSTADLAQRLGVEPDTISVAAVRKVNWRSGALGCPSPGMSYTEALVPGILIMLEANGAGYGYHARVDGQPFLCPPERVEQPASFQAEDLA
jgi:aryl-alcohol dehydrogenase-like predicted oxidoreductase